MPTILEHLQKARESLLDLTLRNRLLNFLPSKRFSIGVVDEIPREIFDILVIKEKPMVFRPTLAKAKEQSLPVASENQDLLKDSTDLSEEESKVLWKAPIPDEDVGDKHLDKYLQTSLDAENLQKKLFYINQQARSAVEEQGVTILYLALGFLEWKEAAEADHFCRAPLILIPVELERASVSASYHLKWTEEDIFTNISLKAKLADQGVDFPEFEMPEDKGGIDAYFSAVAEAISGCTGWNVTANIYLSFFSFTKFVMYKDLNASSWPEDKSPLEHSLIKALFAPETIAEDTRPSFCEDEIDIKLRAHDLYHVMDADPSQIAAIEELKIGRNLVVEGPPGTGKSQTIANAIAELMASGKTVLFVSEKMAALEVVKDRLDKVGLGTFCLELHSRKSNKKDVLAEIERSLKKTFPRSGKFADELDELEKIKTELNHFAHILREPFGKIRLSPFSLYCLREKANELFAKSNRSAPRFSIDQLSNLSRELFVELKGLLKELLSVAPVVKPIHEHPWRFSKAKVILPSDEEDIQLMLSEVIAALDRLSQAAQCQINALRSTVRPTLGIINQLVEAGDFLSSMTALDKAAVNDMWESSPDAWLRPFSKIEEFQRLYVPVKNAFVPNVLDVDLEKMRCELQFYSKKVFRIFDKKYHLLLFRALGACDRPKS